MFLGVVGSDLVLYSRFNYINNFFFGKIREVKILEDPEPLESRWVLRET
jgi:hypothetical protein